MDHMSILYCVVCSVVWLYTSQFFNLQVWCRTFFIQVWLQTGKDLIMLQTSDMFCKLDLYNIYRLPLLDEFILCRCIFWAESVIFIFPSQSTIEILKCPINIHFSHRLKYTWEKIDCDLVLLQPIVTRYWSIIMNQRDYRYNLEYLNNHFLSIRHTDDHIKIIIRNTSVLNSAHVGHYGLNWITNHICIVINMNYVPKI